MTYLGGVFKTTFTIWPKSTPNAFGNDSYGTPYIITGHRFLTRKLDVGAAVRDADDESIIYLDPEINVQVGDYIAAGDQTSITDPHTITASVPIKQRIYREGLSLGTKVQKVMV